MSALAPYPRDPIEGADPAAIGALVDEKLRALVATARAGSPFHAARLAGVRVEGRADLAAVPLLTKDAWAAASPPHAEAALTRPLAAAYVFRSGGSTGDPKFSCFAHDEFAASMAQFTRSYTAAGLRPGDRVANLFAAGGLYASFVFVGRMLEALGCVSFPYTAAAAPEVVADGCARFGIDVLLGFPSWLLQVAPALEARGVRIRKIFYAGEHLHADDRARLRAVLGAEIIASAGYGAVDSGLMGYQCEAMAGGEHHLLSDHSYLEVVHPETLAPVPDGEEGLLLVTNLDRHLHPVLRYRIGDLARLLPGACACGRTADRFELLGRGDDALRLGYATVTRAELLAAFAGEPGLTSAVQLVKRRAEGREALVVRVEVPAPAAVPGLGERLAALALAAKPDLAKLVAAGSLAPLAVEVLPTGAIPRVPVTGKFRGTVDETT
jgi:phenylacetate-coenzyme A ligase PaaK-like adenylate-forming protein